jgi:hypothetical protein
MKNLFKALSNFQNEVPIIHKGTQGYGYTYADLPAIFEIIQPLLKKHGLCFTQCLNGDQLETTLFHIESGEQIKSSANLPQGVELKGMNAFQVAGSSITYFRRYALSSMLGLITDVDNDASGEQKKTERTQIHAKPEANTNDTGKPEKWLNVFVAKNSTVLTKEWQNVIAGIESGKIKSVDDVKKHYLLNKEVFLELQKLIDKTQYNAVETQDEIPF